MITTYNRTLPQRKAAADVESILGKLSGVRRTGSGRWSARCPAHNDRSPSLSVKDTGDKVLLHCFSGCSYRDICDALGIGTLELDRQVRATARGRKIAKLSRRSHKLEALFLQKDFGLSEAVAIDLVNRRISRERFPEVLAIRGKAAGALEYFEVECGLSRETAAAIVRGALRHG